MDGIESLMTIAPASSAGQETRRLKDAAAYEVLTGTSTVVLIVALLLVTVIAWLTAQVAMAWLSGGIFGICVLLFLYGTTFFPYRHQPVTPPEVLKGQAGRRSLIPAADFRLLQILLRQKDTAHLFKALLKTSLAKEICTRLELSLPDLENAVAQYVLPHLSLGQFAYHAANIAAHEQAASIGIPHALGVFLLHQQMHTYLRSWELTPEDIQFAMWWATTLSAQTAHHRRWWAKERLLSFSGLGLSWAAGFTPFLDRLSYFPKGNPWDTAFGRDEEVAELINTLARARQSNVLVVGEPGVGRLGIIKEVARRITYNQAHPALQHQRVLYLHLGQLLSLGGSVPKQLEYISRALDEMERSGNIIAVLDGLGSLIGGGESPSANVTDILAPFFSSQTVRVVVVMSIEEYHLRLKNNEELLHLFEVVQVPPLLPSAAMQLLALTLPAWEKANHVVVPYRSLREIIRDTDGIFPHIPFPEKAFDTLEEATVKAQGEKQSVITPEDIQTIISRKVGLPIGRIRQEERAHLLDLENVLHRRVVNQVGGVSAVARAMIRARAGVRNSKRPIGTFLFLGPTGVGKTETAKALAEAYFGSEEYLQRLDMSELTTADAVSRLIGDVTNPSGRLTNLIADHPFCVLLLDEFEKADLSVQQLFLQVFDEGRLSDAHGREYSFRHTIMIATSNAGAEFIRQAVQSAHGQTPPDFENQLREHLLQQGLFRPELVNRFDGVITFTPLSPEHITAIARLMLVKLNKRLDANHGITVAITDELVDFLIEIGYSPEFGARPMARAIQDTVEYVVAQKILRNQALPGQVLRLSVAELRVT